ncbi:Protein ltv1, partial [Halocaridina rubra]
IEISDDDPGEKWDCESFLSTYSTLYNHPRTITDPPRRKKIAINPRTGVPIDHTVEGLTKRALAEHDHQASYDNEPAQVDTQTLITSMSAISIRPVGETPEERRYRKKALKELRRERRIERKLNRVAFKDEKKRLEKVNMNNRYNKKLSLV